MIRALFMIALAASVAAGDCVEVSGDKVTAGDLARAVPAFGTVDSALVVGYAPIPGAQRVFSPGQLLRLLERRGGAGPELPSVCVVRASEALEPDRLIKALRAALPETGGRIEVVDFSRQPVPTGTLIFKRNGLQAPPNATPESEVLWRGVVIYGQRRSFPVWARVRLSVERRQVVALKDLPAGAPISEDAVGLRTVKQFPDRNEPISELEAAFGSRPRRRIVAGQALYADQLIQAQAVERGDLVRVSVESGAARLRFEAKAESGGRNGQSVYVRNPVSGKRFSAIVQGKGQVAVLTGAGSRIQ